MQHADQRLQENRAWWALVEQAIAQRIKKILAGMGVAASAETE